MAFSELAGAEAFRCDHREMTFVSSIPSSKVLAMTRPITKKVNFSAVVGCVWRNGGETQIAINSKQTRSHVYHNDMYIRTELTKAT